MFQKWIVKGNIKVKIMLRNRSRLMKILEHTENGFSRSNLRLFSEFKKIEFRPCIWHKFRVPNKWPDLLNRSSGGPVSNKYDDIITMTLNHYSISKSKNAWIQ